MTIAYEIGKELRAAATSVQLVLAPEFQVAIVQAVELIVDALTGARKVLLFGNGGSAADSQHIAAELIGRYRRERRALAAIALTTDSSVLTAWSGVMTTSTTLSFQDS
jgi:D-sedoheptulose 7-phosphate isomerase